MPRKPVKSPSRRKTAVTEVTSPPVSAAQIVEALFSVPEIRQELEQESFTRADIELALDDRGWLTPNARTFQELDPATRNIKISQSRMYWVADPLAKQAVRLWTDYSLGDGLSYTCEDAAGKKQIDDFMEDCRNVRLTSAVGQRRSSHKLLIDGDLFFIFFRDAKGSDVPLVRYLDPLQVAEIITAEHDQEMILGYKRTDAKGDVHYYKDWTAQDDDLMDAKDSQTHERITKWDDDQDQVVYHIAFDSLDKRGNGLLTSSLSWGREHRRFMEARVALTQALNKFAWKLTAKVGEKGIQAIQNRLQSSLSTTGFTGAPERNPPNAPAGTFVQNSGVDMTPMPRTTGASDSSEDSRNLRLMFCAGVGIFPHYMGDGRNENLATASAMELPMLKEFRAYQKQWKDAWRDMFAIVLDEQMKKPSERTAIEASWPAILEEDTGKLGPYITSVTQAFPEAKVTQLLRRCLEVIELDNLDEVMDDIEKQKEALEAQKAAEQKAAEAKLKAQQDQLKAQKDAQKQNQSVPPPVTQESFSQAIQKIESGFSKGLSSLKEIVERQQVRMDSVLGSKRDIELTRLAEKEDAGIKALNRLTEAVQSSAQPIIDEAQMEKIIEASTPKKLSKSGRVFRDPSSGAMKFEIEETAQGD